MLTIYACLKNISVEDAEAHFSGQNYGTLKTEVANVIIETLKPLQEKYYKFLSDKDFLDKVLEKGRKKAQAKAREVLHRVYAKLGLVKPLE